MSQFYCVIYIKKLTFFLKLVGLPSDVWPKFTSIYLCFSAPPDPLAGFKGNETTGKEQKEGRKGNGHPLLPPIPWSPLHRQCRINANQGPWQLFARAPLLTRDKDLSQPATRVDTCWQLFRPAINTAHFNFFCCKSYVKLLDYWRAEKIFSLLPEAPLRPEARGICHICHVVNPALCTGHMKHTNDSGLVYGCRMRLDC